MAKLLSRTGSCLLLLALAGCKGGESEGDTFVGETMDTGSETADGDGDGDSSSSVDTNTDEPDTEGSCGGPGCACTEEPGACDPGLSCVEGTCMATSCGDGVVQGDEQCEADDDVDGDGCDVDCSFTEILAVDLGEQHTCVLIEGGRIRCWGRGEFGQLGHGNPNNIGDDEYPSDVEDVGLSGPATSISVGGQHTCALLQDGGLRCWGLADRGQLGYGNLSNLGDDESLVGLAGIGIPPVIAVRTGSRHTCARLGGGTVRCWGKNDAGELGYATSGVVLEDSLPGSDVDLGGATTLLELGWNHACARFIDGGMRCWGWGDSGRLGLASLTTIGDDEVPATAGLVSAVPIGLPANTEIADVSLGGNHGCALLQGGYVLCWGANASGQLGQGDVAIVGDDETPASRPPVQMNGSAVQVAAGGSHTCALLDDGKVRCWGDNSVGQLGLGNTMNIGDDELPSAVDPVMLGGAAKQIAAGANHTCALLTSNEVVCWGQNNFNQLGLGSSVTIGDTETPADAGPVSIF
ncbi:RCC1 domain-containing protein [Nannocystaceae bacterium ST9]